MLKGGMELGVKKFIIVTLGIILIAVLSTLTIKIKNVEAASSSNGTSDVQLLARAINGEARGEP